MNSYYPDAPAQNFYKIGFSETFAAVLRRVYVWMTLGLLITAGTAAFVSVSPLFQILAGQPLIFFVLMIAELGLVMGLSRGINRILPATAMSLFFVYAALNGLTFSVLFVVYTLGSVPAQSTCLRHFCGQKHRKLAKANQPAAIHRDKRYFVNALPSTAA
jgi:FtsH-binding integral membrane protein